MIWLDRQRLGSQNDTCKINNTRENIKVSFMGQRGTSGAKRKVVAHPGGDQKVIIKQNKWSLKVNSNFMFKGIGKVIWSQHTDNLIFI